MGDLDIFRDDDRNGDVLAIEDFEGTRPQDRPHRGIEPVQRPLAGPPMPIDESLVAMITSQAPSSTTLPAKQNPELTPTMGTSPDSLPSSRQVLVDRPPMEPALAGATGR